MRRGLLANNPELESEEEN